MTRDRDDKRRMKRLMSEIPADEFAEFKVACAKKGVTMTEVVRGVILEWLERQQHTERSA